LKSLIEDEEYATKKEEIRTSELVLTASIEKLEKESNAGMEEMESLLKFGSISVEVSIKGTLEQKRMILSCLS